ncbi:tetratricopeptide repeat protein [bacterium]|nr:tetratricopeptide repeat protein [bacterium]
MIQLGSILLLLGWVLVAAAENTNRPAVPAAPELAAAETHVRAGLARQAQADMAVRRQDACRGYNEAAAEYAAAAAVRPDTYATHLLWATCLVQLGVLATNQAEQIHFYREADQRFGRAVECRQPDQLGFEHWASLLLGPLLRLTSDPVQRQQLLERVADVCERGLRLPPLPTPQAQLHRYLGTLALSQVEPTADSERKRALLERAVEHFRAARQSVFAREVIDRDNSLGVALVLLGQLLHDPDRLREAVTELEAALKLQPGNYAARYNLAAAHSLLGETEVAAQQLTVVFDNDPQERFLLRAQQDPDLAAVRATPAYAAAVDRRRRLRAEVRSQERLRDAQQAQQLAARVGDPAAVTRLLQQALAGYQEVIDRSPDQAPPQALSATALARLAQLSQSDPAQQRRYCEAARARFAAAAECPGVEASLFDAWSTFLLNSYYPLLTTPADRQQLLTDTCQVLKRGVALARFGGLRGRLEAHWATCLAALAVQGGMTTNTVPLCAEAVRHFAAAAAADDAVGSARFYELWGNALLWSGRYDDNTRLIRQAVRQFLRSLEFKPDNPTVHYNLACAYARLNQYDSAIRSLERSLENDPQELFRTSAAQDSDFETLRELESFRRLLERRRSAVGLGHERTVSDK